jgi:hypothetical protein
MEDRRATGAPRQAQDPSWLAREGEWVGMVLWAVGITTLAWLSDTRVCSPRYPPMFVVLKLVAAWLWLLRVGSAGPGGPPGPLREVLPQVRRMR